MRAWLMTRDEIIFPSRSEARVAEFREVLGALAEHPNLHFVIHDYVTFDGAESLAAAVETQFGPVTDVVASIGGWWQGRPLWQVTRDEWNRYFVELTTAHFATARAWIPRLPKHGSYQLILGGSATTPVPGASIINMEQAALKMMHEVLSQEVGAERRVFAQILGPVETRQRQWVDPTWVSDAEVGRVSVAAAANSAASSAQFTLRNKEHVSRVLQQLAEGRQEATNEAATGEENE
ncbi:3-oxoacyl-[acyl-carrier protein] reductase [Leucobacter exalbidus]|uniref:3-oxoacyl-[acyl-carrier protein] reductase n=1 Tax=Leucobacter exalbidus TaxID=662960 RepID=A0A940PWB2_9MICO|nr:3-oxoacyl-[acyl-carrier protein] reductase [Leucobacter exalbidus]